MNWFNEAEELVAKLKKAAEESKKAADEYWGKFTPRALKVIVSAKAEAEQINCNYVGSEHLLLGLLALESGVVFNVLNSLGLNRGIVRAKVIKDAGTAPAEKLLSDIPMTPRFKRVLDAAKNEAIAAGNTYIGTEHLLLALLAETDGPTCGIFKTANIDRQKTRQEILSDIHGQAGGMVSEE